MGQWMSSFPTKYIRYIEVLWHCDEWRMSGMSEQPVKTMSWGMCTCHDGLTCVGVCHTSKNLKTAAASRSATNATN